MMKPDCQGGRAAKSVNFNLALCFVLLCELTALGVVGGTWPQAFVPWEERHP